MVIVERNEENAVIFTHKNPDKQKRKAELNISMANFRTKAKYEMNLIIETCLGTIVFKYDLLISTKSRWP